MVDGSVLKPRQRPVLLPVERCLGCGKAGRTLQIRAEPPTNHIMLVFLVCVELSCVAEAPYRMKHSECTFRVFIDFGDYKSQVHRATPVHRVRKRGANLLFYSRKEVIAAASVIAAGPHAALLESGVRSHMDKGRHDQAFL